MLAQAKRPKAAAPLPSTIAPLRSCDAGVEKQTPAHKAKATRASQGIRAKAVSEAKPLTRS